MKAIGYIRVSTDGQCGDDKFGLSVQRQQILDYAEENGHEIVSWVSDEGESGAKEREGFDSICYGDVENPPVEAVIVAKSDRVARDINIYFYYKMLLRKKDIELISVAEDFGQFGLFAPMLEAFTLCVAQMERENINKRTSSGRKMKASGGGYAGGRAPMGYRVDGGQLVVDEAEAEVVRLIYKLREAGHPMLEIVDMLNQAGYKPRRSDKFGYSLVQGVLNNKKTYQGYYKYGKSGEWVKGQHTPIIPE